MKTILLLLMLVVQLLPLNIYSWETNYTQEELKYCEWVKSLESDKEQLDSTAKRIHAKYPYSSPFQRSLMIETEENMWKNSYNQMVWMLNNMDKKNPNLYYLDCAENEQRNTLNWVTFKNISPKKIYSDSKITIEWKWFWSKFDSNIKIFLWYNQYDYQITQYYEYSDNKLVLPIPEIAKNIVNDFGNYHIIFCRNNKCIYSDKIDWKITNDKLSYLQNYISDHKIIEARNTIKNSKKVKIAVLDDGISLNHPDLTNKIWVNKNEIPWNGIDDDKNWYVDDYNSWNFVYNWNNTKPLWTHWTKVAWIIWAQINNNEWIWWIVDNVELISVWVCNKTGCEVEKIIEWIYYAVDNWANIINLSLWWNQFNWYDKSYDEALKYAYDNNIIVVIAWGNWDILSNNGVNTTINKISPVCNNWDNYKNIIWVWALNSKWSNYWDCIDFYTTWESIISTSYWENINTITWVNYAISDWTSFSAPILTWIIWLWYEKYWKFDKYIIYDALENSTVNWIIDANKYLKTLWDNIWKNKKIIDSEKEIKVTRTINNKVKNNTDNVKVENNNKKDENNTYLDSANYLANLWIINKKSSSIEYELDKNVLRQEIAAVAVWIAWINKKTTCDNLFSDVKINSSNNWACYSIEALAYNNIIAKNNKFSPNSFISKAEAVWMMVKVAFGNEYIFDASKWTTWMQQVVEFAVDKGIIENFTNYDTPATRWFVFDAANNAIIVSKWGE